MTQPQLLTLAKVASRTRLDQSTVGKHVRRNDFKGAAKFIVKGHWRWLVPVSTVISFNASRRGK